jgi:Protein of unknown function (DUF2793)
MTDTTPRSFLPLLAAAQAQKHVTHNEALVQLDALSCARLLDRDLSAPPGSFADGDAYLVKAAGTGDWTGQDGKVASALDGAWRFYAPYAGLMAYVADEGVFVVFDGTAWVDLASLMSFQNLAMLGVNTTADTTNKLAVKSSALLFDNIGGSVQAKLNKHAAADTASLLYQTNYSGRAEFGLTGDDNFHCKVSPDGSAWTDAVVVDKTSGALTLAAGAKLPNASASAPALAFNANYGLFYDAANAGVAVSAAGAEVGLFGTSGLMQSIAGGGANQVNLYGEGTCGFNARVYASGSTIPVNAFLRGRGTIAAPSVVSTSDSLGQLTFQGQGATTAKTAAVIRATCIDTSPSDTAMGGQLTFLCSAIGAASPSEIARLEAQNGLSLFGANPVIDQNRGHRLRSTTIAGAVAPSVAGNLFYHSDAQGGAGEVSVDTASAYRHAGQAAIKHLTSNADATYTPRLDGRIVRDTATLSAARKLTLAATNVTDGHKVEVTRRGSSGGFTRGVYQADGTTLIASLADNAGADFVYDAGVSLWFQK